VIDSARFARVLLAVALSLVSCPSLRAQTWSVNYDLQKQWEVPFGLLTNWVLCPDGSLYGMADKQGEIRWTSSDGKTAAELVGTIEPKASLLGCDQKRRLYAGAAKVLDIYQPDAQGGLVRVTSAQEKFVILGILVTPDGTLYALSEKDLVPTVNQLSSDGSVLRSFHAGRLKPVLAYPLPPASFYRIFDWDKPHQRIVVRLDGASDAEWVDAQGHWESASRVVGRGYGVPWLMGLDRVISWKDQYIAQVTFKSEIADVFNVVKLEVLDKSFQTVWSRSLGPDGLLVGASSDGGLYFLQRSGGTDFKLARYVLTPADVAP
jgi:hypothetical protein